MKIKNLFDTITERETHQFNFDEFYEPKANLEIETPNGLQKIVGMIIKKDNILNVETTIGNLQIAAKHKIKTDKFVEASELKVGDVLYNTNTQTEAKILNITTGPEETVYDVAVDSEHEYLDAQGFLHHNTYGTKQTLTKILGPASEGAAGKWIFKTGEKASAFGVYKNLLLNKHKIVVYDDSDSIWRDKDIINMLKAATADDGERYISWGSGATANVDLMNSQARQDYEDEYISELIEDPNTKMKPPSKFLFEGQFINISNLPGSAFQSGDLEAIASRSIFINVHLAERDVLRRIATIMEYDGDSEEDIKEILDVIAPNGSDALEGKGNYSGNIQYITPEDALKHKTINMRTANIAKALKRGGAKDWKRMSALYS